MVTPSCAPTSRASEENLGAATKKCAGFARLGWMGPAPAGLLAAGPLAAKPPAVVRTGSAWTPTELIRLFERGPEMLLHPGRNPLAQRLIDRHRHDNGTFGVELSSFSGGHAPAHGRRELTRGGSVLQWTGYAGGCGGPHRMGRSRLRRGPAGRPRPRPGCMCPLCAGNVRRAQLPEILSGLVSRVAHRGRSRQRVPESEWVVNCKVSRHDRCPAISVVAVGSSTVDDHCLCLWLIGIAVAYLAPALAHGGSLGGFDLLGQFGIGKSVGPIYNPVSA